jgi:hypothetical protein
MNTKQSLHLLGLGSGVAGYAGFVALIIAGVAAAPLALVAIPAGLALALATGESK